MTDQQRGSTVLPGHRLKAKTPRLDEFRKDAVTFAQSYSPSPHCCPSRASFFTGLYPSQHGVWNNVNVTNALSRGPREGTPFWSEAFLDAGYDLAFSGKWHVSNYRSPADYGWRELMPYPPMLPMPSSPDEQRRQAREREITFIHEAPQSSPPGDRKEGEIIRPGYPRYVHYGVDEDPFRDAEVVDHAVTFIRNEAPTSAKPWFLYVGTLGPHDPYTPPQRFLDMYDLDEIELPASFSDTMRDKPNLYRRTRDRFDQLTEREQREALRHYLAFCSYEDYLFGNLLDALAASGTYDDTVILYVSDHGDYTGDHGLWCKGLPSFESAYHIPTIVTSPRISAKVKGQITDTLISLVDMGPTLLELCGVASHSEMAGQSFAAWLTSEDGGARRGELFFQSNGNEAYGIQRITVTNEWKLVCNFFDDDELYDRVRDPDEMNNLLSSRETERRVGVGPFDAVPEELREVVQDLYRRLWTHALAHDDEVINEYIMTALATYGPGIANGMYPTVKASPAPTVSTTDTR